jgi:multidrug transporter EmrE-like cation transporter
MACMKGNNMNYILLFSNVLFLVIGQVLFKYGLQQIGGVSFSNAWKAFSSPLIILGLVIYVISTGLWFVVLSRMPLSFAYPVQSLAYALVVVLAWLLFHEQIGPMKWIGVIILYPLIVILEYKNVILWKLTDSLS